MIESVRWTSVCSGDCAVTSFTLKVTNLFNPYSTAPNSAVAYTVSTFTSANGKIDTGSKSDGPALELLPNVFTIGTNPTTAPVKVGATASYTLSVTNTHNLIPSAANSGKLEVTFPSEIRLLTTACSATYSSVTLACQGDTTN